MPILLPNAAAISATSVFPAVPLSELAKTGDRTSGERNNSERMVLRENTIQAFIVPGVLPEEGVAGRTRGA